MITDATLLEVQDHLMAGMTALYLADKDDELAQHLAGAMVMIHESISMELMERMMSR